MVVRRALAHVSLAATHAALVLACGGTPAPSVEASAPVAAAADPCAAPAGGRYLIDLISPVGAAALEALLSRRKPAAGALGDVLRAVYAEHPDHFDLLFLVIAESGPLKAQGRFIRVGPVNRPQLGLIGRGDAELHPIAPRLEGLVVLRLPDGEGYRSGPALHESLHRYGQYLPAKAGFPRNGHWGHTGVNGQLGGFDPESLRCAVAGGQPPECPRDDDGRMRVVVDPFSPFANGGDRVPYAPLELYLMGLLPPEELPARIPRMRKPEMLDARHTDGGYVVRIMGLDHIETADVLAATDGPRPPASAAERNPRAAFVLVSAKPASEEVRGAVSAWARGLAGAEPDWPWQSYCSATGGRARMETRVDRP